MGYYQDNFPGSPAQKLRKVVGRWFLGYTLVVGTAFFFLSPGIRRMLKDARENPEYYNLERFLAKRRENSKEMAAIVTIPTLEQFYKGRIKEESIKGGDLGVGEVMTEEYIRSQIQKGTPPAAKFD